MKTNYSIIMVDDDPDDHFFFQEALKKINTSCTLTSVYSGADLLNLLQKKENYSQSELEKPDLVIMDLNMPGLNGLATLEKLKSHVDLKNLPVHILSTSKDKKQIGDALELGAKGFHTKPNDQMELQKVIAEILIML